MREGYFEGNIGINNLHPFNCTQWGLCIGEYYSYGCPAPKLTRKHNIKRNGKSALSEFKNQRNSDSSNNNQSATDSYCEAGCLNFVYLTRHINTNFKLVVLHLPYNT